MNVLRAALYSSLLAMLPVLPALAQDSVKIGFISEFSGSYAATSREMSDGFRAYQLIHGDTVAGKKIEVLNRDTTGPVPDVAKRLASELVTIDKADIFTGFGLTPNALAVIPVANQAKIPTILMNATSVGPTLKSPFVARVSLTIVQETAPLARWALKNNIKSVVMLLADYAPGVDAEESFKSTYTAGGGKVISSTRLPLNTVDFSPYIQKARDAHPDGLFVFFPNGDLGDGLVRAFNERQLAKDGIKLMAAGEIIAEKDLDRFGAGAVGLVSTSNYSAVNDRPENRAFVDAYFKVTKATDVPGYMGVAGFDGAAVIYKALEETKGDTNGAKLMAAISGMKMESPRGPISIDAKTRDISETIYVREVRNVNGHYQNVTIDSFPLLGPDGN